jgi:hypothetical protein
MATPVAGARSTFNDTIGLMQDISQDIPILVDPFDVPLYLMLGSKPPSVQAYKHEWQEEGLQTSVVTLNDTLDDTEVIATFAAGDAGNLKAGDLLQFRNTREIVRVSSISGNDVTVDRGYAGTSGAAGLVNDKADVIGQAVADGADPADSISTGRDPKFNFQQTFQEKVSVTDLDSWVKVYGLGDKFAHEVEKKLKVMAIRSEKAILYGARFEDSKNKTRLMGGLTYFIKTNATDENGVDVDEDLLRARMQQSFDNGGRINLTAVGPTQKGKISQLISAAQRWYPNPTANEIVGVVADKFRSDFGDVALLMDRNIRPDEAFYLETDLISKISGMPFTLENLAKTGTTRNAQIVGWFSFELKAEKRHAYSKNLKTT